MITYVRTNIFESNAQVLVNTVNTVGIMGKGLAKEFKRLYPDMFASYQRFCENKELTVGKLQIFRTSNKIILNFPTKKHWRNASEIEYIESGLKKFVDNYEAQGITSIAFPMLGCGNGGLDWNVVKPIMEKYLKRLPIEVFIHIAKKDELKPEHINQSEIDTWLRSEPQYLSSIEFFAHLKQKFSGLLNSIHKLDMNIEITIESIDEEEAFCLQRAETRLCMTESTLANIWRTLKNDGVLRKEMLSSELAEYSNVVMAFLSELDYITLTQIGDDNAEIAVRILAFKQPIDTQEKELFVA